MKTKITLIIISLFYTTLIFSQNQKIDSLQNLLTNHTEDTNKINILNDLSWEFRNINPDTSIIIANEAIKLSEKLNFRKGIAINQANIGAILKDQSDYYSALKYYKKSLKAYEELDLKEDISILNCDIANTYYLLSNLDTALIYINTAYDLTKNKKNDLIVDILNIRANIYREKGDDDKAMIDLFEGLEIAEIIDNKQSIYIMLGGIALIQESRNNYDKAIEYHIKALEIVTMLNDKMKIAISNANLGIIYARIDENDKALINFKNSLEIFNELNAIPYSAIALYSIGVIYNKQEQYELAFKNLFDGLEISQKISYDLNTANCLHEIANIYEKKEDYENSYKYYFESLELRKKIGTKGGMGETYESLSNLSYYLENYKEAYEYLLITKNLRDSIYNSEKETIINELTTKYETEKKEQQIEIQTLTISKQKLKINSTIAVIIIVLLLASLILYFWLNKKRAFNILFKQNQQTVIQQKLSEDQKLKLESEIKQIKIAFDILFKQNQQIIIDQKLSIDKKLKLESEIKQIKTENKPEKTKKYQTSKLNDDKKQQIWDTITELLEKEQIYLDPLLSISKLTEKTNSNKTYISQIISEFSGEHFNNFVNLYRVNDARKILSEPQNNIQIKTLYSKVGFKSTTTFYNSFKKITGFSPTDYRKRILRQKS